MTVDKFKLLSNQGIGKRYHSMSLADSSIPQAKDAIEWIEKEGYKEGGLFMGQSDTVYDLAMLTARGLILSSLPKLNVMPFPLACMQENYSQLFDKPSPILITNFEPIDELVDIKEYKKLETVLLKLSDNNYPVMLHIGFSTSNSPNGRMCGALGNRLYNNKVFEI